MGQHNMIWSIKILSQKQCVYEHIYVLCVCVCNCVHMLACAWICVVVHAKCGFTRVYTRIVCSCVCVCACTCAPRSQRSSVSQSRYMHRIWDTDLKMYRTENAQLEKETAKNEPEMFFLPFPYSQGSYMERKEKLQRENNLIPTEWKFWARVAAEELWMAP